MSKHATESSYNVEEYRLERCQERSQNALEEITSYLDIPEETVEVAEVILRLAVEEDLFRGRNTERMVMACIYAACRQQSHPVTFGEIINEVPGNYNQTYVGRAYRYISSSLGLSVPPVDPRNHLNKMVNEIGVTSAAAEQSQELLDFAVNNGVNNGVHPLGVVAAALRIVTKSVDEHQKITQTDLSAEYDVSPVAIRDREEDIFEELDTPSQFDFVEDTYEEFRGNYSDQYKSMVKSQS